MLYSIIKNRRSKIQEAFTDELDVALKVLTAIYQVTDGEQCMELPSQKTAMLIF
jgi:hypothetical protein